MNRHKDINILLSDHLPCMLRMSHVLLIMSWLASHMFLIVPVFADLGRLGRQRKNIDLGCKSQLKFISSLKLSEVCVLNLFSIIRQHLSKYHVKLNKVLLRSLAHTFPFFLFPILSFRSWVLFLQLASSGDSCFYIINLQWWGKLFFCMSRYFYVSEAILFGFFYSNARAL